MFGGRVFQQTVGIPMGANCAPLLADLFLYSYEADFIQGLLKKKEKKLARSFNFMFRYIDDVLSLNNSRFGDFVDRIYPIEYAIKDTTDTDSTVVKELRSKMFRQHPVYYNAVFLEKTRTIIVRFYEYTVIYIMF